MPAFSAASGSFHVKSSSTSFVTVFVTLRLLPFFLTVVLICSCTLMVSTFRARSYTDQRYWSMHSSVRVKTLMFAPIACAPFHLYQTKNFRCDSSAREQSAFRAQLRPVAYSSAV